MTIRTIQTVYGFFPERISRKQAQRFILAHAAVRGIEIPKPPITRFWCRKSPDINPPEAKWMVGWTGPVVVREEATKAENDIRLITFPSNSDIRNEMDRIAMDIEKPTFVTPDKSERGALVT
jgi:hypothetical protein